MLAIFLAIIRDIILDTLNSGRYTETIYFIIVYVCVCECCFFFFLELATIFWHSTGNLIEKPTGLMNFCGKVFCKLYYHQPSSITMRNNFFFFFFFQVQEWWKWGWNIHSPFYVETKLDIKINNLSEEKKNNISKNVDV